ncbi:MAG: radical SAM protein [Candidatus Obscuribacterales bacterium]|nr:radical SAM protein [Candidatus Obscuribacterales bacterium]
MEASALFITLHSRIQNTVSNGPGQRYAIWVQGCTLACEGCFNADTHSLKGARFPIDELADDIIATPTIEGVTISGGEPFQQMPALAHLVAAIRKRSSLSILIFTGFTREELLCISGADEVLSQIDVLIAGRFRQDLRVARGLVGSANKVIHFLSNRYTPGDLDSVPQSEIIIASDGTVTVTGINPLELRS